MRIARAFVWIYPAFVQCGSTVTPSCYETFAGIVTSVHVSQSRSGEQDDVDIKTETAGNLTATLEPSASAAPHVRTGANVTVKRYRGQVTLVTVDGYGVASTANPDAARSDTSRYGWLFTGLGVVSAGYIFYSRRRRNRRAAWDETGPIAASAPQQGILPSGTLGWSVRPTPSFSSLGRYAFGVVALVFLTLRALLDPARTAWALAIDSTVVFLAVAALLLFYRNARVFADRERVAKVNLLGRTKSLPVHDIQRAERYSVANRYGAVKHLVFVGPDGRKAFEVSGIAWDFDRLDDLCREAGVELGGSYDDLVGAFKLNSRVPGTTTWSRQLLLGCGFIVALILFVVLLVGPTQR